MALRAARRRRGLIMALDAQRLSSLARKDLPFSWRSHQSCLYALSIGFGREVDVRAEQEYLLPGATQRAVPTMASVMTVNVFEQDYGWQYEQMLHGEQYLRLHRPLRPAEDLLADFSVDRVHDKGVNRPAMIVTRVDARRASDGSPLFTLGSTLVARADGGFDGPQDALPSLHVVPDRSPDLTHHAPTRPEQAFLYRFNGDHNPLHLRSDAARLAGFPKPILQGLCTYGFACRAILETICDFDHTLIGEFNARFTGPVFPGEVITTLMWQEGEDVSFRCRIDSRNVTVLDHGYCRLLV
ncbi:MAG: MaoC/PaaZ C-terminal domain-containing protein [Pseudomonadota bacterium]